MTAPRPSRGRRPTAATLLRRREAVIDAVAEAVGLMSGTAAPRDFSHPVLRLLGEGAGVSRVYVFEFLTRADGRLLVSQRFEWTAPGISPQIDNPDLQELDLIGSGYGRWQTLLLRGRPVVGDIADFPARERPLLKAQQIRSLLVQPIFAGPRAYGMIGFDACTHTQAWDHFEVSVLRIAAQAYGAAVLRAEREAQLRHMQRMEAMGHLAGGVAHDFNNLLTILGGAFAAMPAGADTPARDRAERLAGIVRRALDQGHGLTRRLLEFSRPGEGRPRELDLARALARSLPLLRQAAGNRIRVQTKSRPCPGVRVDPVQLEQVLLNLVINARDAQPKGGRVILEVGPAPGSAAGDAPARRGAGSGVLLRVADAGPGIPPELRRRVFEPFFTTKGGAGGTGLGLSTVYAIVTGHGGAIEAGQTPEGGAEFRIVLPTARGPAPAKRRRRR